MTRLGDVVDMTFGFPFKSSDFTSRDTDVRLLRGDNIVQGRLRWSGVKKFPVERSQEFARYQLAVGDVVLAMDRPWIEAGLKYSVIREADTPSLLVQRVARLRARDELNQGFLALIVGSRAFTEHVIGVQTGSAVPHISGKQIADFSIGTLPSLEEQRGIAATLGALDDKIESNRRAQSLIEQLVQADFEAAFSVDEDPDGKPVSSIVEVNPRRSLGRGTLATYIGMSSLSEHVAEIIDWDVKEFASGQKFVNGDVLMARITPCLENGKTAVVDMLQDNEVGWGSTEYVVLAPRELVSTPWVYCLVRSEPVRAYAIRSMSGTSGRQRFQADGLDKYRIAVPDNALLQAFNAQAIPLFQRMTTLRDETRALVRLRDALLPELLSGRIRVPEAREVVGEVVG